MDTEHTTKSLLDIAKHYAERGKLRDVNAASLHRVTPPYTAACQGHAEIVGVFLSAGADKDKDMANNDGTTSLLGAVVHGHAEIVRALILAGADKDKKTHDGSTARDIAATERRKTPRYC